MVLASVGGPPVLLRLKLRGRLREYRGEARPAEAASSQLWLDFHGDHFDAQQCALQCKAWLSWSATPFQHSSTCQQVLAPWQN